MYVHIEVILYWLVTNRGGYFIRVVAGSDHYGHIPVIL